MDTELSEEHRVLWIRTVLAMSGTQTRRNAFIDGYNDYPVPPRSSATMKDAHALGREVFSLLREKDVA